MTGIKRAWHESILLGINRAWHQSSLASIESGINRVWHQKSFLGINRAWHQSSLASKELLGHQSSLASIESTSMCPASIARHQPRVVRGTIFEPKGFDISRLCHSNLSRSEGHSFLSMAKKGFSGGQLHLELEQQNQNPMAFSIRLPDS